jgi:hypothetical protein
LTEQPINTDYVKTGLIFKTVKKFRPVVWTTGGFGFYQSEASFKLEKLPHRYTFKDCPVCGKRGKWWLDKMERKAICNRCNCVFMFHPRVHKVPTRILVP